MEADSLLVQIQKPDSEWVDVGHLHSSNNRIWFKFLDSYWSLPQRPVLGQTFEEHGRAWSPSSRVALPNWFSHLLPEGRMLRAVAAHADTDPKHEFVLLKRLGISDLPGAVRVLPVDDDGTIDVPRLAELEDSRDDSDPLLKFSLAGAQLKFSVYGGTGGGLTVPAAGQAGNVILKFPDNRRGFDNVPEAELGCLELAATAGIDAARGSLVDPALVEGLEDWAAQSRGLALAVDRFDRRTNDVRVHMEEFAQVIGIATADENAKYRRANFETIAVFVEALCGTQAVAEVIDRIVLNVLVGNGDAHLKNWAIVYTDGMRPSLSPLYDVLPTVLYIPNDDLGLKLNKSRLFESVTAKSFERIGTRTAYTADQARVRARESVDRILSSWPIMSDHLTKEAFRTLSARLRRLPLVNP
ncbi:MAG TPA: type II toxin-antitoxin system HipA family toxin [Micromonosporaceae bacterium]